MGLRIEPFKKVRRIKTTQSTDRGIFNTIKNQTDGFVEFESLGEASILLQLIHDPHCIDLETQPKKIPSIKTPSITYIPDIWAKFSDGIQIIFDIKHSSHFDEIKLDQNKKLKWEERTRSIAQFCKSLNLQYQILTEEEIRNPRLENIQFFRKNHQKPPNLDPIELIILNILKESPQTRYNLTYLIASKENMAIEESIRFIDYMIYHDYFQLDFESKITNDTILKVKTEEASTLKPIYQYLAGLKEKKQEVKNQQSAFHQSILEQETDTQEFQALDKKSQQEISKKIKLLSIFHEENPSTQEIKKYANSNGIGYATLYRWRKVFQQHGWQGLIPKTHKRGRIKGKNVKLEHLIEKTIQEWFLTKNQPSISKSYEVLELLCNDQNIEVCSLETFRRRVHEYSEKSKILERKGRKVYRDTFKPLKGESYPFGKFPMDTVEFDHTPIDVIVVDQVERKPVGRLTLTLGIDVYSRMIYGYYLSYKSPRYLSVGMCFLTGILPKDKLCQKYKTERKWPIQGIPKQAVVDNAKEFRSGAFNLFCKQYGIDLIFNAVHKPEQKPHVERVLKTINLAIRDDLIGGYTSNIAEKRKTNYNPEKYAHMTFDEFEEWLVKWIVDYYHFRVHGGIKEKEFIEICPFDRYNEGLLHTNERFVGKPKIPASVNQLFFDVLLLEKRMISRNGIRLFGLEYNAPIINQLLSLPESKSKKYEIRYDPRDIREVYLWVDKLGKYFPIQIKNVYFENLNINPENRVNYTLSLKEFKEIKKNRRKQGKLSQYDLSKAIKTRQEHVKQSRLKAKTAKRSRKKIEIQKFETKKATSIVRRKNNSLKSTQPLQTSEGENLVGTSPHENPNLLNDIEEENYIPTILTDQNDRRVESDYKPEAMSVSYWNKQNRNKNKESL